MKHEPGYHHLNEGLTVAGGFSSKMAHSYHNPSLNNGEHRQVKT